jgi:hypothetical protein
MNIDINLLTEAEQVELVAKDPFLIEDIKNPSEAVQLEAVKQNGYVIIYIKKPTKAVQLEFIKENDFLIKALKFFIKNPTQKSTSTPKPNIPPTSFSGRTVLGEVYLPNRSNIPPAPKPTKKVQLEVIEKIKNLVRHIEDI